ncbi:MAG: DUF6252 family protein [Bacteroidota bacterium]|nr:DUF6252 family protein [Bacteroidota bacterium]
MKITLIIISSLLILISCKKEVDELPAVTQTGANTFGARVKGELWIPQGFGVVPTAAILEARFSGNNSILINARNFSSSPTETEIDIYLQNATKPGTYLLNQTTAHFPNHNASYGYYVERRFTPTNEWITNNQYTGKVEITRLDTVNNIISGTFEFNAINLYNTPQPISITDGRFDVKIQ